MKEEVQIKGPTNDLCNSEIRLQYDIKMLCKVMTSLQQRWKAYVQISDLDTNLQFWPLTKLMPAIIIQKNRSSEHLIKFPFFYIVFIPIFLHLSQICEIYINKFHFNNFHDFK